MPTTVVSKTSIGSKNFAGVVDSLALSTVLVRTSYGVDGVIVFLLCSYLVVPPCGSRPDSFESRPASMKTSKYLVFIRDLSLWSRS